MNISQLAFQLVVIFIPGVIAYLIVEKLTIKRNEPGWYFPIYSFLLGLTCYAIDHTLISFLNGSNPQESELWLMHFAKHPNTVEISSDSIFRASLIALPVGLLTAFIVYNKVIMRLAHKIKLSPKFPLTNKFDENDLWRFLLDSESWSKWVEIPDRENGLVYQGYVQAFSDSFMENEILLVQVKVYSYESATLLYDLAAVYLTFPKDKLRIHIPYSEQSLSGQASNASESGD